MRASSICCRLGSICSRILSNADAPRPYGSATSTASALIHGTSPRSAAATRTSSVTSGASTSPLTVCPSQCARSVPKSRNAKVRDIARGLSRATSSRCARVAHKTTPAGSINSVTSWRARKGATSPTSRSAAVRANGSRSASTTARVPALATATPKPESREAMTASAKADRATFPSQTKSTSPSSSPVGPSDAMPFTLRAAVSGRQCPSGGAASPISRTADV